MKPIALLLLVSFATPLHALAADDLFLPTDLARLAEVTEPAFAPDGQTLVYTVGAANLAEDKTQSDLWSVRHDGGGRTRLTDTPDSSEWRGQWSADGRRIAFLSDRKQGNKKEDEEEATTQVWIMSAQGGQARRLTDFPDGVEDFVWSPDGQQLAVIAWDPEFPAGAPKPKNPPPIVTERYQFKEDGADYLGSRRKHLY
ncbi:MAG: TolB family protein, partial [Pseudoxanthomonas sp.]